METITLLKEDHVKKGHCKLVLRTHDLGGANYRTLFHIKNEIGHGIANGDNGIDWLYPRDGDESADPVQLKISLRDDPVSPNDLWAVYAQSKAGNELLGHVEDSIVNLLERDPKFHGFEGGAPDWKAHSLILKKLRAQDLRERSDAYREAAEALEAEIEQAEVA